MIAANANRFRDGKRFIIFVLSHLFVEDARETDVLIDYIALAPVPDLKRAIMT